MTEPSPLRSIRRWTLVFIVGLVLSGVTAFPLVHESDALVRVAAMLRLDHAMPSLFFWLTQVANALAAQASVYPFLAYGTDWLAFGHIVIAIFFLGLYRDPVRNRWLVDAGLVACAGVLPLAFIAGPARHIPFYWRCIDASFGIFGALPLLIVRRHIDTLEADTHGSKTADEGDGNSLVSHNAAGRRTL